MAAAPFDSAIAPSAVSTTLPAAPLEPGRAAALIPLAPLGPLPDKVTPLATFTVISPPLLVLAVEAVVLAICAPPVTVSVSASTVTEPPGPDCGPVAEAAIWVLATPAPSRTSAPGVVTLTGPPLPIPAVVLEISAPDVTVTRGAVTIKLNGPPAVT